MTISVATIVIAVTIIFALAACFFIYKVELDNNIKQLKDIIKIFETAVAERENTINDLHLKIMAKDLTDYKVNTRETSTEFVQTEPTDIPLETATDEQFLKAIKEAPAESGESAEPVSQ